MTLPLANLPVSRRYFLERTALAAALAAFPTSSLLGCGDDDDSAAGMPLSAEPGSPWWLQNNFAPVEREIEATDLLVRGSIPPEINGTYIRNGSNPRSKRSPHWFLGDGMLHAVRIENGRALWYRNRYVRTPFYEANVTFDEALEAGLPPFAGNNQSNVAAIYHAGKLLTSGEVGAPYEIDPVELSTVGVHDFEGRLGTSFTAHPKIDPATGYMHFFGYGFGNPYLTYHVADDRGELINTQPIEVGRPTMIHSFAITDSDVVFWEFPVVFDFERAVDSIIGAFQWEPEYGARIGVMPLNGRGDEIRWVEVEPRYVFHEVNAYRDGDDVVVDVSHHPEMFRSGTGLGNSDTSLRRWYIGTAGTQLTFREEIVSDLELELGSHDRRFTGRPHRYGWLVETRDNPQTVDLGGTALVDFATGRIDIWEPGITRHTNEAYFVPGGPGEGEGWLLTFVHDHASHRSVLAVLDALDVARGPVTEIEIPARAPYGFHATFIAA